jgi:hypothetical protein
MVHIADEEVASGKEGLHLAVGLGELVVLGPPRIGLRLAERCGRRW